MINQRRNKSLRNVLLASLEIDINMQNLLKFQEIHIWSVTKYDYLFSDEKKILLKEPETVYQRKGTY